MISSGVDSDSIAGLQYVLERWPSLPLAVVLATRTDSLREKDAVSRLLGGSLMRYEPSEFFLGELSRKAASELVDTISEGRVEGEMRDRIFELSGRNPFFIVQLTNHASAGGRLPNLDPGDFVPAPQSIASALCEAAWQSWMTTPSAHCSSSPSLGVPWTSTRWPN